MDLNLEASKVSKAQRRTKRKPADALGVDPAQLAGNQSTTSSEIYASSATPWAFQNPRKIPLIVIHKIKST
jgi:hypothetical protein